MQDKHLSDPRAVSEGRKFRVVYRWWRLEDFPKKLQEKKVRSSSLED